MNDDEYLKAIRSQAGKLRYAPADPFMERRMIAGIHHRLNTTQRSVLDLIMSWARPITAGLATILLASSLAVYAVDRNEIPESLETVAEAAMIGEDIYLVVD